MNAQGIKSGYAFSRNPIILRENFPSDAFDKKGGWFTVSMGGTDIYEGRFFPPLRIDLSEILDAYVSFFPEPPENNTYPIIEIEDAGELSDRDVYAYFEYDGYDSECEFTVIPGGISKQNYKRLCEIGKDIFNTRFFNFKNNFFLTTRTAGWRIVMKETELFPLYFFITQHLETVEVMETVTRSSLTFDRLERGVYALDIDALRRQFSTKNRVIPSVFDIYIAGVYSCRIVVERSDISKERYRLKFRNSLGVFEIIELTGSLSINPDYSDSEEATFKRYDPITGSFYSDRERVERKQSITVETGVKRPDEVRFLMDMIGSEEVYLLDLTNFPLKVIPTVEDFSYKPRPDAPEKFTLKLDIADSEINIMQEIIDGTEGRKPRVFSKQFSNQFN